jgi:hypothetical protein
MIGILFISPFFGFFLGMYWKASAMSGFCGMVAEFLAALLQYVLYRLDTSLRVAHGFNVFMAVWAFTSLEVVIVKFLTSPSRRSAESGLRLPQR